MGLSINTNVNSLLAQQYLTGNRDGLAQAMQRLASGMRINDAADDPAGLAVTTSMKNTSGALRQAGRNGNDGVSLVQTAQTAINDISGLITTMTQLATQAANGTYSSTQLSNLNTEFAALNSEINRVANVTAFNGVSLLNGTTSSLTIQVGSNNSSNDQLTISLSNLTTGTAGLNTSGLSITSMSNAQTALTTLNAITSVTTALASLGANEVNLNAAVGNDNAIATSLDTAASRISDADFAAESSNLAKFNILSQSNVAMLAQANTSQQIVLQLLKG